MLHGTLVQLTASDKMCADSIVIIIYENRKPGLFYQERETLVWK